ncbi:Yeast-form wall Protein 1, partial [Candida tropicalis]
SAAPVESSSVVPTESSIGESSSITMGYSSEVTSSSSIEVSSSVYSSTSARQMVSCYMNGKVVSIVDYETGICEFTLPDAYDTYFRYVSSSNYDIKYYYAKVNGVKYTTDIQNGGRVISVPAKLLVNQGIVLYVVHLQKSSTRKLRRDTEVGFDSVEEFIKSIADSEGTSLDITISNGSVGDAAMTLTSIGESGAIVCEIITDESASTLINACESVNTLTHADSSGEAHITSSEWIENTVSTDSHVAHATSTDVETTVVKKTVTSVITQCSNNVCSESTATLVNSGISSTLNEQTGIVIDTDISSLVSASSSSDQAATTTDIPAVITANENSAAKSAAGLSVVGIVIVSILVSFA